MGRKKRPWIEDERRKLFMNAIYNSARKGESSLLVGEFGSGKTTMLGMVAPRSRQKVELESLDDINELLASILNQCKFNVMPHYHLVSQHLREVCALNDIIVVVDEVNDIRPKIWPYFKRMMNAGIPMILAGLPETRTYLERKHADILSRLRVLDLQPINSEEYKRVFPMFDADAIDLIYAATGANMRLFERITGDCLEKLEETGAKTVDVLMAAEFCRQIKRYN